MQTEETEILDYLKAWSGSYISGKEIARKVGGKERFAKNQGWAIPILAQLVRYGILETDQHGGFRIKPVEKKKRQLPEHVSPQILKILKSSGKSFEGVSIEEEPDKPAIPAYRNPGMATAPVEGGKA